MHHSLWKTSSTTNIPENSHGQKVLVKSSISNGGSDTGTCLALHRRVHHRRVYHRITRVITGYHFSLLSFAISHSHGKSISNTARLFTAFALSLWISWKRISIMSKFIRRFRGYSWIPSTNLEMDYSFVLPSRESSVPTTIIHPQDEVYILVCPAGGWKCLLTSCRCHVAASLWKLENSYFC